MLNKDLKTYFQILLATTIVSIIVLLAMHFLVAQANAAILPSTITINGKSTDYVTYRNALIAKVAAGKISHSEVKTYIRILNLENKLRKLKGWTIQQMNQDILTRKI